MFEHRIENRQELMHTRDQGDLGGLAGTPQPGVKGANHRIPLGGDQRRHRQDPTDRGPAAPAGAAAPRVPLSRLSGATPTNAANGLGASVPSSGSSARRVRLITGPMPGTLRSRSSFSRHTGSARISCVRSFSSWASWWSSHARCAWICWCTHRGAPLRRCCSAVRRFACRAAAGGASTAPAGPASRHRRSAAASAVPLRHTAPTRRRPTHRSSPSAPWLWQRRAPDVD